MFARGKPFQPSLMFVGKAGAYLLEAPQVLHSRVGSNHTIKNLTRLERLARNKRCSLLQKSVNYGRKKFHNIGHRPPGPNVINFFTMVIYPHSMVILSFCVIKQHYLGNYFRMMVNYHGICVTNVTKHILT